jgi:hypothetical protein
MWESIEFDGMREIRWDREWMVVVVDVDMARARRIERCKIEGWCKLEGEIFSIPLALGRKCVFVCSYAWLSSSVDEEI